MFIQFFIVTLVLVVLDVSFNILPLIMPFTPELGLWISFTYLLYGSCNGYVYFCINTQVRRIMLDMWMCRDNSTHPVITISMPAHVAAI